MNSEGDKSIELGAIALELLDALPFPILAKDADGLFRYANTAALAGRDLSNIAMLLGKSEHEVTDFDLGHMADQWAAEDQAVLTSGTPVLAHVEPVGESETDFWLTDKIPFALPDGEPGLLIMVRDILERVRDVVAQKDESTRFELLSELSSDGFFDARPTRDIRLSPRLAEFFDLPEAFGMPLWSDFGHMLPPSIRSVFVDSVGALSFDQPDAHFDLHRDGTTMEVRCKALFNHFGEMVRVFGTVADVTSSRENAARLKALAETDHLTGIPNRRAAHRVLDSLPADGTRAAVIFIDFDEFKLVNDALGHDAGDQFLVAQSQRLLAAIRPGDFVARVGGDEFIVLVQDDPDLAVGVAERISNRLTEPLQLGEDQITPSISVGLSFVDPAQPHADILREADLAMYEAKRLGGNATKIFDTSLLRARETRLSLRESLRKSMADQSFALEYQTISYRDCDAQEIWGCEALLRWRHESYGGAVPPNIFVPLLEEHGLIHDVGDWVINEALEAFSEWSNDENERSVSRVSVNLSALQFDDSDGLISTVSRALVQHRVPPEALILEVTESVAMKHPDRTRRALRKLQELGVSVALDDFGVGESSLGVLATLPVDIIKLDGSFTSLLGRSNRGERLVKSIVSMADALGATLVAERVETLDEADRLSEAGVELMQGYLLSKPLVRADVSRFLRGTNSRQPYSEASAAG